jgi:nitrate reductase NapE component
MKTALRLFLLFVGFGLLPLWIALIAVFVGAQRTSYSEYWAAAPWVIVFSLPICVITLAISTITTVIYFVRKGRKDDRPNLSSEAPTEETPNPVGKKSDNDALKQAARGFGILVALAIVGGLGFLIWIGVENAKATAVHRARQSFVETHPLVISTMPPKFSATFSQARTVNAGVVEITYHLSSKDPFRHPEYVAVIDVDRRSKESFQFKCLIPYPDYKRLSSTRDVCSAWDAQQKKPPEASSPPLGATDSRNGVP